MRNEMSNCVTWSNFLESYIQVVCKYVNPLRILVIDRTLLNKKKLLLCMASVLTERKCSTELTLSCLLPSIGFFWIFSVSGFALVSDGKLKSNSPGWPWEGSDCDLESTWLSCSMAWGPSNVGDFSGDLGFLWTSSMLRSPAACQHKFIS